MLLRDYVPALKYGAKILASEVLGIHTTGNVYYVIKKTESFYDQFVHDYHTVYADGSSAICPDEGNVTTTAATALLNTGIQDALDKCVASRGDYVVIVPSTNDYDIGAELTMTKRAVHLVCPLGMNNEVGSTNAARIHQVGSYNLLNLSDQGCEVAGLYFKSCTTYPIIEVGTNGWSNSIHHNTFWWYGTTTTVLASEDKAGQGLSYSHIWNNYFIPAGSSTTTTDVIYVASGAFPRVTGNVLINANSNTMSNVINLHYSPGAQASNNVIGDGGSTITRAITVETGIMSGNMLGVAATADVAPSTNTNGAVGNWSGATGGAAADQAA